MVGMGINRESDCKTMGKLKHMADVIGVAQRL